jgi:hypothetical protein
MTTYESKIKTLNHSQEVIYTSLSDLNNLALIQNRIPQDKIKDLSFDTDTVNMTVDKLGKISLRIIDREPYKTIKLTVAGAPSEAFMWIQLKEVSENNTKLKLTIKTKLNGMVKMMLKGKIEKFIDGFADTLAGLDYSKF